LLALLTFIAGLGEPQVGGALRALWPALTLTPVSLRQTAVASSSVILEASVLGGPLLLAPVLTLAGTAGAILFCGCCP